MFGKGFKIKTDFEVGSARQLRIEMASLSRQTDSAGSAVKSLRSTLRSLAGIAIGASIGSGLRSLTEHFIETNSAMETTKIGLAATLEEIGLVTGGYERASKAAGDLQDRLRKTAAAGPGAFDDYVESFQAIAAATKGAGASMADLEKLTTSAIARQKMQPTLMKGTVAQDIQQILGGSATTRSTQTLALKYQVEALNKMVKAGDKIGAFQKIMDTLEPPAWFNKEYGQSFDAQIDTLKDSFKSLELEIGKSVMPVVIEKVKELNNWFVANKSEVALIADQIADGIVGGIEFATDAVKFLKENWDTIVDVVKVLATVWVGKKLVGGIETATKLLEGMAAGTGAGGALMKGVSALAGMGPIGWGAIAVGTIVAGAIINQNQARGERYKDIVDAFDKIDVRNKQSFVEVAKGLRRADERYALSPLKAIGFGNVVDAVVGRSTWDDYRQGAKMYIDTMVRGAKEHRDEIARVQAALERFRTSLEEAARAVNWNPFAPVVSNVSEKTLGDLTKEGLEKVVKQLVVNNKYQKKADRREERRDLRREFPDRVAFQTGSPFAPTR